MILHLFRRTPREPNIADLYGMIVAQARREVFYRHYGVPDTVNGRFEMLALHVVLLLNRLEGEGPQLRGLGQGVFDLFCADMDASMREMGVGDLAVPRKMRRLGAAFYDRQAQYRRVLAVPDDAPLLEVLAGSVFDGAPQSDGVPRLARYVRSAVRELAAHEAKAFTHSEVRFPVPESVSVGAGAG